MSTRPALLALALVLAWPATAGPALVIYRCVAADGAVTLQNGAQCPRGMRQQRRVVDTPASTPPAPRPAPPAARADAASATAAAPPAVPTASPMPVPRLPAPMLYACLAADARRYYADEGESARCVPVEAVGLDGRSPAPADACEVVRDRCAAVAEAERCAAWAERRRVAEQALTFAPEAFDAARAELARVEKATAGTVCAR